MAKRYEIYKCNVCGNIVEILHAGKGQLVCCNQPMNLLVENTVEASYEKHIPVISKEGEKIEVKVGSVPHPMEETHYIEWIEILTDGRVLRQFLSPKEEPKALFYEGSTEITAREYCNLHGLWKSK
ncbi:MAG: desulfoferrodoxin [Desulfobacterota bacterium]|nr:desulfoferrodoxin [Thermodesulfobacteriota bacterium]MDW8001762.1 desulfoferrodoxin [Deltaproteobacteria bacterium]